MTEEDCPICCEKYTSHARKIINCPIPECTFQCCYNCCKRWILKEDESFNNEGLWVPKCMVCKKEWGRNFLSINFNKSFMDKVRNRGATLRLISEKLILPEVQFEAQDTIRLEKCHAKAKKIKEKCNKLRVRLKKLKKKQLYYELGGIIGKYDSKLNVWHQVNMQDEGRQIQRTGSKQEKFRFKYSCPQIDCRGYLDKSYKCSICDAKCCSKCLDIKNENHECSADAIATLNKIKSSCKPCPTCGEAIERSFGCNQMWVY